MSLRAFHLIFVAICIVFSVWVGLVALRDYRVNANGEALTLAIVFFLSGVVLVIYGRKVFTKLRDLP